MKKKVFCNGRIFLLAFLLLLVPAFANASSALLRNAVQEVVRASPPAKKKSVFKGVVLSSAAKMDKSFGEKEGNAKFKFDSGVKVDFTGLSLFAGAGLPLQTVDEIKHGFEGGFSCVKEDAVTRWGLMAETPASYPLRARALAGTLGFSHSLSLLKSPLLSGGSSLRGLSFAKGDIGCSMPSLSSAQREESVYASVEAATGSFRPEVCAMYSRDGTYALSASFPVEFAKGCLFEAALAGGMFLHGNAYASSWFCKTLPYKEQNYASACSVANLRLPLFKSSSVFGLNQNPFGGFYRWFRTVDGVDLSSVLGLTSLSAGFFTADQGMITAGGSRPDVARQFFLCASHAGYVKDSLLRGGTSFRRTLYAERASSDDADFFGGLGLGKGKDLLRSDISFNRGSFALAAYASGEFDGGKDNVYKAGLSWRQRFEPLSSSLSFSGRKSGEKDSLSFKLSLRPEILPDDLSLNLGLGVNGHIMEGKLEGDKVDSSLALSFKGKFVCVNAKFSFSCEIQ
ncbi:MAG: hypothetical protein II077_05115 [Treponema sp.]|nr:hypothetical protein [Treponema sp.]